MAETTEGDGRSTEWKEKKLSMETK